MPLLWTLKISNIQPIRKKMTLHYSIHPLEAPTITQGRTGEGVGVKITIFIVDRLIHIWVQMIISIKPFLGALQDMLTYYRQNWYYNCFSSSSPWLENCSRSIFFVIPFFSCLFFSMPSFTYLYSQITLLIFSGSVSALWSVSIFPFI